jgi:hypothetical protein
MDKKIEGQAWIVAYLFMGFVLLFGVMLGWILKGSLGW